MREDYVISNTWAAALTSGTLLTHTLMQMPAGQVVDSLGARRAVILGISIIGLATLAAGIAPDLAPLLASRLAVGVGTSISFVAGLTVTNRLVPAERRILAQSVYGMGASFGTMFILLFSERLALFGGWRGALLIEGTALLLAGCLVSTRLGGRPFQVKAPNLGWGSILRQPLLYLLGLAHIITYGVFIAVTAWIVTFLYRQHGVGLEWSGPLSATLSVAAVLGRIAGGLFSTGYERGIILFTCVLTGIAVALLAVLPSVAGALAALFVFGWAVSVPFGAIFAYISLLWRRTATGRELSTVNFIANLGALSFPLLAGYLLDVTGSFAVAFGALGAITLGGSAVLALWLPRVSGDRNQQKGPS